MARLKRSNKSKLSVGEFKYGQIVEQQLAKGKSMEKAHKIASSSLMRKPDKFDKPSLIDKAILGMLRRSKKKKKK